MPVIESIGIPIRATFHSLGTDLAKGYASVKGFAERTSTPVPVALNLSPLEDDVGRAKELAKKAAEHISENFLAAKIAPALSHSTNHAMLAKSAIDAGSNKAADVVVNVSQAGINTGIAAAKGSLKTGVKALSLLATIPLTVSSIAIKVGLGLAQAAIFAKVKQMTGMSTIKLLLIYAGIRVGLGVAKRLLVAGVRTLVRVATFPFKVALGALRAGLRAAKAMVSSAVRQMAGIATIPLKVGATALGLGLAGTALGGLVGVPAAIAASVMAASDLNETVSKVGFTFGESSKIVTAGAQEMADKYGVVKRAFLDGAAGVGLIGKAAGQSDAESAKLGVSMASLAADLSSFANLSFEDSLEKIRSGLVGEAEPLRAVGVLLSENAVKARAAQMGFAGVKGELSEGQKVMARAALIAEGLKTANGDLGRTSGELANRLREIWGRVENLAATLGSYLLPAAKSVATAFAEMTAALTASVGANGAILEAWGAKIKAAADWLGIAFRNLSEIKKIAGLAFADVGKYLQESLKNAFTNAVAFGKYFAETLGFQIEKSITMALHEASPTLFAEWVPHVAPMAPQWKSTEFKTDPAIAKSLDMIKAAEALRLLAQQAKLAVPAVLGIAGSMGQARNNAIKGRQASVDALNKQTGFMAHVNPKLDRPPLPRGFSPKLAGMPAMREAGDEPAFTGKPRGSKRVKINNPADAAKVIDQITNLNARMFGGLGTFEGPAMVAATVVTSLATSSAMRNRRSYQAPDRFAGLAEAGSQDAYSAILRHASGAGKQDKSIDQVASNTGLMVEIGQRTETAIGTLASKASPMAAFSF